MLGKKLEVRRRKWKRYTVKGGSIVYLYKPAVIGSPNLIEMGPIVDISMGGMAFQYMETKKRQADWQELSIGMPSADFQVDGITFDEISDFEVALLPDGKSIRNRCVRFDKLTPYLTYRLEAFIKQFAMQLIEDRRKTPDRRSKPDPRFHDREYATLYERRSNIERRIFTLKKRT